MGYRLGTSRTALTNATFTGGPLAKLRVTDYSYAGAPGWRYVNDPLSTSGDRTWSDWRGYAATVTHVRKVTSTRVTAADVSRSRTLVYRGLNHTRANGHGDRRVAYLASTEPGARRLPDWPWLAGRVVETDTLDPTTGARLSRSYTAYRSLVTAKPAAGSLPSGVGGWGKSAAQARYTYTSRSISRPHLVGSRLQHTVDTVVNSGGRTHRGVLLGQVTRSVDYGSSTAGRPATSPATGDQPADNTCVTATYASNRTTRLVVPTGSVTRNGCSGAVLAKAQTLYDGHTTTGTSVSRGRATRVSAWANPTTRIETDYRYDARGRATGVSAPHAPGVSPVWTTTTFNPGGNTWDPTTWVKTTLPAPQPGTSGPGGASMVASTRLDLRHGHPTSTTDVNGQTTSVTLDGLARVTSVSYPGHPAGVPNIRYSYAVSTKKPSRVVTRTLREATSSGSSQVWDTSTTVADGWGRTLETHTPRVNAPDWPLVSATGYDEAGRQYLTLPGYIAPRSSAANQAGGSTSLANASPSSVEQAALTKFDGMSRPVMTVHQSKGVTLWRETTVYTGDTTTSRTGVQGGIGNTDGTGLTLTKTVSDVFGRARSTSQYANAAVMSSGLPATGADTTATYSYSPTGLLSGIASALPGAPGGKARYAYAYDWLGRRTTSTDPDTGRTTTTYDVSSNPVKAIDAANAAAGIAVQTTYDRWNRPIKRQQTGSGGTKTLASWTYDSASHGKGRPASSTSYTDLGTFTTKVDAYDPRGQVTRSTQTYPASLTGEGSGSAQASKSVSLAYDQAGLETTRVHPGVPGAVFNADPVTQTTSYTTGGAVSRVDSRSRIFDIPLGVATYDKYNRPAALVSGRSIPGATALTRRYAYDPATGDLTATSASDEHGTQMVLGYRYDAAGRPIRVTGSQPLDPKTTASPRVPGAWCYHYDAANRLTRATTGAVGTVTGNTATCTGAANTLVTGTNYDLAYAFDHTRLAAVTDRTTGAKATYAHASSAHPHALTSTTQTGPTGAVDNGLLPASGSLTYDPSGRVTTSTVANPTAPGSNTAITWDHPTSTAQAGTGSTRTTYDPLGNPVRIAPLSGAGTGAGLTTVQAFDADGTRIARQEKNPDGTITSTVFLAGLDLTHTVGQDGREIARHFTTPAGTPLATRSDTTGMNYLFTDAQQSVRLVKTNVSRTPGAVSTYAYTPYGNPFTTRSKPTTTTGVDPEPRGPGSAPEPGEHGYLNKTHDPGGDLRLDHRSYTPTLGTLTTPDPLLDLANPQNLNPYSYAGNNPIVFADPSGLQYMDSSPGSVPSSAPSSDLTNVLSGHGGSTSNTTEPLLAGLSASAASRPDQPESQPHHGLVGSLFGTLGDNIRGTVSAVTHAPDTVKGLYWAVTNPQQSWRPITHEFLRPWYNMVLQKDQGDYGGLLGSAVGESITIVTPGAALKELSRLKKLRVAAEAAKAVPETLSFGSRAAAREGLPGDLAAVGNRFFRGATSKSQDFQAIGLPGGGYRLQFFSPANNPGYGKLYVQEIDRGGNIVSRYKDTIGPDGFIERKMVQ
jgi:RHS repeat-associated protein